MRASARCSATSKSAACTRPAWSSLIATRVAPALSSVPPVSVSIRTKVAAASSPHGLSSWSTATLCQLSCCASRCAPLTTRACGLASRASSGNAASSPSALAVDEGDMNSSSPLSSAVSLRRVTRTAEDATAATSSSHAGPMTAAMRAPDARSCVSPAGAPPSSQPTGDSLSTRCASVSTSSMKPSLLSLSSATAWCTWSHSSRLTRCCACCALLVPLRGATATAHSRPSSTITIDGSWVGAECDGLELTGARLRHVLVEHAARAAREVAVGDERKCGRVVEWHKRGTIFAVGIITLEEDVVQNGLLAAEVPREGQARHLLIAQGGDGYFQRRFQRRARDLYLDELVQEGERLHQVALRERTGREAGADTAAVNEPHVRAGKEAVGISDQRTERALAHTAAAYARTARQQRCAAATTRVACPPRRIPVQSGVGSRRGEQAPAIVVEAHVDTQHVDALLVVAASHDQHLTARPVGEGLGLGLGSGSRSGLGTAPDGPPSWCRSACSARSCRGRRWR
eukprot:scaffold103266_cov66-Phaeocystis_antarctica.AAC.12